MQLKEIIQKTTEFFRNKGFDSPRLDTELLIAAALHWDRVNLYLNYDYPLSPEELNHCRDFVRRRASGEPVAYILGEKGFYKHTFTVTPAVLIPRPETETLVEETIAWLGKESESLEEGSELAVIDLGAGSGCIGLSILADLPQARLLSVDISDDALTVAKTNADRLGLAERVQFLSSDAGALNGEAALNAFGRRADVVVANPPYIAPDDPQVDPQVKAHEPSLALFSDNGGLAHIEAWAKAAAGLVREDGLVMFEIGHEQGRSAAAVFEKLGCFRDVKIVKDLSGRDRFVRCIRSQEN